MLNITPESSHPDVRIRHINSPGELVLLTKGGIAKDILELEKTRKNAVSAAELKWINEVKLGIFFRLFGY